MYWNSDKVLSRKRSLFSICRSMWNADMDYSTASLFAISTKWMHVTMKLQFLNRIFFLNIYYHTFNRWLCHELKFSAKNQNNRVRCVFIGIFEKEKNSKNVFFILGIQSILINMRSSLLPIWSNLGLPVIWYFLSVSGRDLKRRTDEERQFLCVPPQIKCFFRTIEINSKKNYYWTKILSDSI